ncbi:MAG: DUF1998 domain-containing protein [Desulfovibrionaceae bacterium]|nr:DUF1998 domain-containing protein [Desulfovibrionaceae bacterium]
MRQPCGQPALILTFCEHGNYHDQHFFMFPEEMVAGSVSTPKIDLANEDLIRAHIHAIWLAHSKLDLKMSVAQLLNLESVPPSLEIQESVSAHLADDAVKTRTIHSANILLESIQDELADCSWYSDHWVADTVRDIPAQFDAACERWRVLFHAAVHQREVQNAIATNFNVTQAERKIAKNLRGEAESQVELLLLNKHSKHAFQSDFYSYRYFASEGFLPGYNFPRLPLSAYIPKTRDGSQKENNDYVSRARFLAISEFGPGSIIYHEGSHYKIHRVMMDVDNEDNAITICLQQCKNCGYIHYPRNSNNGVDQCELCGSSNMEIMTNMFRMRNVSTIKKDRISSDEEERLHYGYRLETGFRFVEHGRKKSHRDAQITDKNGCTLFTLQYGQGAELWRINFGWLLTPKGHGQGFLLNRTKGIWVKDGISEEVEENLEDIDDYKSNIRVIPYVQDRKNCLRIVPNENLELNSDQYYSLKEALKQAIQQVYQLEDNELSCEVLPSKGNPNSFLFVESAEGGAGVLRRLVEDQQALAIVAKNALEICHFDPETGNDLFKAPYAKENCIVACYDCLLSYANQRYHKQLNRHCIKDILLRLQEAQVFNSKDDQELQIFEALKQKCDSALEKDWLTYVFEKGYKLPTFAQFRFDFCNAVADFYYAANDVAIFIDGPLHECEDVIQRDAAQERCLEDQGVTVLRFTDWQQWQVILNSEPEIFGKHK